MLQHNKKGEKFQPNTFVDGVHVKISEQYKPPRRIVLPVSCQNCTPGEALYSEYDFKLEENILNKLAEWKIARREQVEKRKERLKTETKVCEEIEHFSNISIGSSKNEAAEQTHQSVVNQKLSDSVLTPISAKQNSPSHKPASSKFNLSDFESDNSSPFDNLELKTINDMEVLKSILTSNNVEQSIHNNNHNITNNNNNNNSNNNNNNNNNNNIIDKEIGKNCIVLNNKNTEWGFAPLNGYSCIGYSNSDDYHRTVVPLQKDFNQCGFYPVREHIQISNYGLNDFSNQFGAAVSLERAATFNSSSRQEPSDLGKSVLSEVTHTQAQEENSRSVPDIMFDLEAEIQENREREEELERRNKLAYLKETVLSSTNKEKKQMPESSRRIQSGKALSRLPDPTGSLNPSSQKLVQYISEMGFPAPRVARACQMFNEDDKKIIEFLVEVQRLEEKNYPGDLVEKALMIHKFKLKESLKYLEAMVVLLDLGFDEEKAEEALIATNSDRDKALDMLIS